MLLSDVVLIPLLVVVVPMGFVWVTRHNATMQRAKKLLAWSVPFGALALVSLLVARGGGLAAVEPAAAFLGFGFIGLILVSWSVQTAIVSLLQKPRNQREQIARKTTEPKSFDAIGFRALIALLVVTFWSCGLLANWLWTGSAKNFLRPIGILGPSSPSTLTFASEYRQFTLQVFLLALIAVLALIGLILQYRALARRGQV